MFQQLTSSARSCWLGHIIKKKKKRQNPFLHVFFIKPILSCVSHEFNMRSVQSKCAHCRESLWNQSSNLQISPNHLRQMQMCCLRHWQKNSSENRRQNWEFRIICEIKTYSHVWWWCGDGCHLGEELYINMNVIASLSSFRLVVRFVFDSEAKSVVIWQGMNNICFQQTV